ncbi:hypothetical protein D3C87_1825310 [compost metagenome]
MATTGTRFHHQNQGAHHLPLALGQQAVDTIPRGQLLLPLLQGGKGKLQGTGLGIRHGVKIPQGNGIFRPGAANSDGHETSLLAEPHLAARLACVSTPHQRNQSKG